MSWFILIYMVGIKLAIGWGGAWGHVPNGAKCSQGELWDLALAWNVNSKILSWGPRVFKVSMHQRNPILCVWWWCQKATSSLGCLENANGNIGMWLSPRKHIIFLVGDEKWNLQWFEGLSSGPTTICMLWKYPLWACRKRSGSAIKIPKITLLL